MKTECFTREELEKLAYVLKAVAHRTIEDYMLALEKRGDERIGYM